GLPITGNCPECGKAIAESLPSARVGSAWQQHRNIYALACTLAQTVRHPWLSWRLIQIDRRTSYSLQEAYMWTASAIMALSLAAAAASRLAARTGPLVGAGFLTFLF